MGGPWVQLAHTLADRLDTDLPRQITGSLAVDPSAFRTVLGGKGLAYHDPSTGKKPDAAELQRTAQRLIRHATRKALISGAVGGMAGAASVPPEVAWRLVQLLRLAQRLSVVYGHDPTTDRGRLLVQRALASGFQVELPDQQGVGLRVRDLPVLLRDSVPSMHQGASWLAQVAVRKTTRAVIRPIARSVPGLGAGPAAWRARRTMQDQAERMHTVFRRAWNGSAWNTAEIVNAIEVG